MCVLVFIQTYRSDCPQVMHVAPDMISRLNPWTGDICFCDANKKHGCIVQLATNVGLLVVRTVSPLNGV